MAAQQATKRARGAALEATVTTESIPGLGEVNGMFVRADGTRLFSTNMDTLLQLPPSGMLSTIAGNSEEEAGYEDGAGIAARLSQPEGMTVDLGGNIVLVDGGNHALRR